MKNTIPFNSLTGIPQRWNIRKTLQELINFEEEGEINPVITGYNWYSQIANSPRYISFSHMHENEDYKKEMLKDLDKLKLSSLSVYASLEDIEKNFIRSKSNRTKWEFKWKLFPGLKTIFDVRDPRKNLLKTKYNDYKRIEKLEQSEYFTEKDRIVERYLIGEDHGWQLDVPFNTEDELRSLASLFLEKTKEKNTDSWPGAYITSIIIVGEEAMRYGDLKGFKDGSMFYFEQCRKEICFLVSKEKRDKLDELNINVLTGFKRMDYKVNEDLEI